MLAKCANPECSNVFRYHRAGKLFRMHSTSLDATAESSTVEHFWLCPDCAPKMTIAVEPGGRVLVLPRTLLQPYRESVGKIRHLPRVSFAELPEAQPSR